jgi:Methyltransferase domain
MSKALRKFSERNGFLSALYNIPRLAKGYQPIFLDYPVKPVPRYGYGKPPHPELTRILAERDASYSETLTRFLELSRDLSNIPLRQPKSSLDPCWINKWLDGLDTIALYGFVATERPALYVEVGSGYSTKVVRRSITDQHLPTKLVSIDPHPRAQIDKLCDEVIRQPLENCDLSVLRDLKAGDVFFMDGSHRSFMNSDVTVFFLEILPRLRPGVLVHIHDIYLPLDYMPDRAHWYYSEQYLLAASLLAGHAGYTVVLPNNYISITPRLADVLTPFWNLPALAGVPHDGCSFWLRTQ